MALLLPHKQRQRLLLQPQRQPKALLMQQLKQQIRQQQLKIRQIFQQPQWFNRRQPFLRPVRKVELSALIEATANAGGKILRQRQHVIGTIDATDAVEVGGQHQRAAAKVLARRRRVSSSVMVDGISDSMTPAIVFVNMSRLAIGLLGQAFQSRRGDDTPSQSRNTRAQFGAMTSG